MSFAFSAASESRLSELHPDLVRVLRRALSYGVMDFKVTETLRTYDRQVELKQKGLSKTLASKHLPGPDGKARAADIAPWPIDWNDSMRFHVLAGLVLAAAAEEGVKVRWGGQWDGEYSRSKQSFNDLPHFELVLPS